MADAVGLSCCGLIVSPPQRGINCKMCQCEDVLTTSWNGNEVFFCFLRTGGKLLLKLLHFFSLATLHVVVSGIGSVCQRGHSRPVDMGLSEFN